MDRTEAIGRFIHGMILEDEASNAIPVGCSSQSGNSFTFTVELDPEDPEDFAGPAVVRVTVEVMQP